jgi:iron complex transport system substrate-binding protein
MNITTPSGGHLPAQRRAGSRTWHRRGRVATRLLAVLTTAALAAGCASAAAPATPPATSAAVTAGAAAGSTTYPLTITNCGRTLHLPAAPQRIVSLWPSITEMLISLGAGDRIAGQAFTDQAPPLPRFKSAFDKVRVLATDAVSREVLLSARPDLIVADGEYHFNGKELPSIADLGKLGIPVYIISSFCHGAVTTGHVTDVYTDLAALGAILNTAGQAGSLKKTVAGQLSAAAAKVKGKPLVPVALLQIYDKAVYADAEGLYSDVVSLAGGTNIYDGQLPKGQYYAQVSVEDVAKKNPGTIVYLYESDADKASTLAYLKATFPTVAAVRAGRLIALPATDFIDMRAVDGVTALAAALHPAAQAS